MKFKQGAMLGPTLGIQQPQASLQAWERVSVSAQQKGIWSASSQIAGYEPAMCPGGREGPRRPHGLYQ